jgi:hypothetical protein
MLVRTVVVTVLAGCGFAPRGGEKGGDVDGGDASVDASVDVAGDGCPASYVAVGGGRYRLVREPATWMAALADCADDDGGAPDRHTHLVVFADDAERTRVRAAFAASELWIGLSDRVTTFDWLWVTGEDTGTYPPASGPPWRNGQPTNGAGGLQDCVAMDAAGAWDDRICDDGNAEYLCECDAFMQDPARI